MEYWAAAKKKLSVSVAVPPAPVRVPCQRPLAPNVASVTLVANDKDDKPCARLLKNTQNYHELLNNSRNGLCER